MNAIEIKGLEKRYDGFQLGSFDLTLPSGCIMGLVGENGAGKSTTIKLIMNAIGRDAGEISVLGVDNRSAEFRDVKEDIGVVLDEAYFPDDIAERTVEFIRKVYGAETLEENLAFVASALGGRGETPREVIRNYYLNDFYADHLKTYQKRPIYWLCDSGKAGAFRALFYLHRYDRDTVGRIRMDYVHELQDRLRVQLDDARRAQESGEGRAKAQAGKRAQKLEKQLIELGQYEEQAHHLADMRIPLDLDDGVKVNYAKLGAILGKIK